MEHLGGRLKAALPFLLLAAASSVATFLWPEAFLLTREGLADGEVWRLWSGHLVHAGSAHLALDCGAALVLLTLVRPWRYLLLGAPLLSLAILAVRPDLESYCGLSGLLHGWTILAAALLARDRGLGTWRVAAGLLVVAVTAKAAYEAAFDVSLFTTDESMGVPTIREAHLLGAITGLLALAGRALRAPRALNPGRSAGVSEAS